MAKALKELKQHYEDAELYWSPLYDQFEKYENMYWGRLDKPKGVGQKWKSRAVDNIAFEAVERMASHLLSGNPKGRYTPAEPSDEYGALVNNALFEYQWSNPKLDINKKIRNLGVQAGIFGISFGVLDWKYETKRQRQSIYTEEGIDYEETEVEVCDQPWFKTLYIYDCFPDPSATSIEDMQYFIYDEYLTIDELKDRNKAKIKPYKNLGKLEERAKDADASQNKHRTNLDRGSDESKKIGRILVRTEITRTSKRAYAPDYGLLIQDIDNPYDHGDLNIHMMIDYSYPNQLFGRGEIEPIRTMQKALNNVLNQRLDNVRLILNTGFKAKANSRHMHTWKMRPGWIALVDDMDELQPFSVPDVTSRPFLETTNYFKDSTYRTLGYTDFLTRNETEKDKTATEVRASVGEQNARMKDKEKYVDAFMTRLAEQWLSLNQQFMTVEKIVKVVGADAQKLISQKVEEKKQKEMEMMLEQNPQLRDIPQEMIPEPKNPYQQIGDMGYLEVTPEDIMGRYDYMVESGSLTGADPAQEASASMMALKTMQELEGQLAKEGIRPKYQPVLEKILRQLGFKNTDDIFEQMSDQEMQAMAEQQMMAQQGGRRLPRAVI